MNVLGNVQRNCDVESALERSPVQMRPVERNLLSDKLGSVREGLTADTLFARIKESKPVRIPGKSNGTFDKF